MAKHGKVVIVKIGINGFGRIGRLALRAALKENMEVVGINDITDSETLAYLLKYDSIHGRFDGEVSSDGNSLSVDGKKIPVSSERDPSKLDWGKLGAEVILECTGLFRTKKEASKHIQAGAKKVLISAPAKDHDGTFIPGINSDKYDRANHHVISIGSCTTNCLAPLVKVLLENFGLVQGYMTTIHAYTSDQRLQDTPHQDLRRARAAAVSMIPTTTGAAKAISEIFPELKGRMDGTAVRVPTICGSLVDLSAIVEKEVTTAEVNEAFKAAAADPNLSAALEYCQDPIVSVDVLGNPHGSILDSKMTWAKGKMVKLFSWYDNEWGFSCRMIDMLKIM
ncbi:MAG: type I glyceraldehyde-3-phosphate dehydrogenase [candidate division Zixibacteria bacterium]|nr:type I glyceraldehyde-3-phosphate dehydrogenase [candidate division Zixibacteria bacterium]